MTRRDDTQPTVTVHPTGSEDAARAAELASQMHARRAEMVDFKRARSRNNEQFKRRRVD